MAKWLRIVVPIMIVEWILFKWCYPFADYFTDSYTYIDAAVQGDTISFRPIGYSVFLRLVHAFTASDLFVVTLQYAILQGASLGLVLSLRRWCKLGERTVGVLMAFLVLNPVVPYVCNYISSDALFIGFSLIWLSILMGLLRDPGWWRLGLQLILLFVIFNLRYTALFYPAVAALTVLLARRGWVFGIVGVAASIGVVIATMLWIRATTKKETGADLFSAFSGWQIANNALHVYAHLPVDTVGLPSAECRELAGYVKDYFDGVKPVKGDTSAHDGGDRNGMGQDAAGRSGVGSEDGERNVGAAETTESPTVTTAYMWVRNSPLHRWMQAYRQRNRLTYFEAWNRSGTVFTQYGNFVARRHPFAYIKYYGWPSAGTYFLPDLGELAAYNEGKPDVDAVAMNWFHYPRVRTKVWSATMQARLLAPLPWIFLLLNLAFVAAAVLFLPFAAARASDPVFTLWFRLAAAFLLANAMFGVFASPSVFRYLVLPMIVLFVFAVCAGTKSRFFFVT
jgi:hypothetical protein